MESRIYAGAVALLVAFGLSATSCATDKGRDDNQTDHNVPGYARVGDLYGIVDRDAGSSHDSWPVTKSGTYRITTGIKNKPSLTVFQAVLMNRGRLVKNLTSASPNFVSCTKSHAGIQFNLTDADLALGRRVRIVMTWKGKLTVHDGGLYRQK